MDGRITKLEHVPEYNAYRYEGELLGPGEWKGIDGHSIKYEDSKRPIKEVFAEAAPTFTGKPLVHGHHRQDRGAVKGFNASAWLEGDVIRNRGYIFDPEVIESINRKTFPMAQSMEAWVWTDENMVAQRIVGEVVAIGISKPAYRNAWVGEGKGVKLEMGDDFVAQIKAKLEEQFTGDENKPKIEAIMGMLKDFTVMPDAVMDAKRVVLGATRFAELKAAEEAYKSAGDLKTQLTTLQATVKAMDDKKKQDEKQTLLEEIKVLNAEFKHEEFLKDIPDHGMQMRMLKAYYGELEKLEPILPSAKAKETKMSKDDEERVFEEMTGTKLSDFLHVKEEK